jgi:hypothetical protein
LLPLLRLLLVERLGAPPPLDLIAAAVDGRGWLDPERLLDPAAAAAVAGLEPALLLLGAATSLSPADVLLLL